MEPKNELRRVLTTPFAMKTYVAEGNLSLAKRATKIRSSIFVEVSHIYHM